MIESSVASLVQDVRVLQRVATALHTRSDDGIACHRGIAPGSRWRHLTIERRIARGSYGAVYGAYDARTHRHVALKVLHDRCSLHALHARLFEEARAVARVRHPNVVKLHGFAVHRGRAGLWMDFIDGCTLERWVRDQRPIDVGSAARIGIELCAALGAVHDAGLVHGDVKSENLMRAADGRLVLIDFGSASGIAEPARARRRLTGTPLYLAPEVLDHGQVSVAGDIYSVGVLLFYLLSLDYPVAADSVGVLAEAHRRGAVRRLRDVRPDLPDAFCSVIDRTLSPDPRDRPACARELQSALGVYALLRSPRTTRYSGAAGQPSATIHRRHLPPQSLKGATSTFSPMDHCGRLARDPRRTRRAVRAAVTAHLEQRSLNRSWQLGFGPPWCS